MSAPQSEPPIWGRQKAVTPICSSPLVTIWSLFCISHFACPLLRHSDLTTKFRPTPTPSKCLESQKERRNEMEISMRDKKGRRTGGKEKNMEECRRDRERERKKKKERAIYREREKERKRDRETQEV